MKQQTKKKLLQVLKIVDIGVLGFIAAFTFLVVTLMIMGDILGTDRKSTRLNSSH